MDEHLLYLYIENGFGCFTPSSEWIKRVTGELFCPHCNNIYESVKQIDAIVNNKKRQSDVDFVFMPCGHVQVFSTHFIDIAGPELLGRSASFGRLLDEKGFEHEEYRAAISRNNNVVIRGPGRAKTGRSIGICKECDRLLYWPVGGEYVIRREVPEAPIFLSDGHLFCTPEFYERRLSIAMLRHVSMRQIPILDEPLDGLPASTKELRSILKASGQVK